MRRAVKRLRRWLYIGHQWIGIGTCLLFAMWFVSGLVMMYVAFPNLTDRERLAALPDIAWDRVAVAPDRAMAAAGLTHYPRDLRLNMLNDEPVYRLVGEDGRRQTISAADGRAVESIAPEQALAAARRHPAATDVRLDSIVDRDQWSVTARFDPLRPFFLVALGDAAGTELNVSERSGEIVLDTTRVERIWNWLGSIPHWIYRRGADLVSHRPAIRRGSQSRRRRPALLSLAVQRSSQLRFSASSVLSPRVGRRRVAAVSARIDDLGERYRHRLAAIVPIRRCMARKPTVGRVGPA
jgi:hypothetical protein